MSTGFDVSSICSPEAEQFVLGGIFNSEDPDCFAHVAEMLSEHSFAIDKHRIVFRTMATLYSQGLAINYGTMLAELDRTGDLKDLNGDLILLTEGSAKLFDLESFCRIVAEKHRLRLLYIANRDMEQRIIQQDRSLDIITGMQTSLLRTEVSMPQMKAANPAQIVDAVEGGVNGFLSPARDAGIMTWWPRFNHATNGLRRGRLYAIGAKPGIGKTSLACNIALAAVFNGHRTKIDTYEMSKEEYLFRLACTMARVDSQQAEAGYLNREDRGRLADALRQIVERSAFLEISDSDNETTASLAAYLRKEKAAGRPFALQIVDYLQKMSGIGRFERREQEVAQTSGGLKKIAHKMKIPVVVLAQLNTTDREMYNHQPSVDDFRESKALGADADVAIIIRLTAPEQLFEEDRQCNLYIPKQRGGKTGNIPFTFKSKYTLFEEHPKELRAA